MIKISKHLYIHWLFIVVWFAAFINRTLESFFMSYAIITIHELSHLAAAKYLGLTISHIIFYPFGLNMKLKNDLLYSISDEVILYLSGPLSNALMAVSAIALSGKVPCAVDFYYRNIVFFVINLLPVSPLDGGMIAKKLFCHKLGYERGIGCTKFISVVFVFFLVFLCCKVLMIGEFNASLCIFTAFVAGNIIFSKEKYNRNFLKELLYCKNKRNTNIYNAKIIGAAEESSYPEIAKKINMSDNYFIIFTNENQKVTKIMSEDELIGCILDNNNIKM
ncbi:MAG: hypothetical protein SOZ34_03095 [Clostridia bacterium]|nr:hypothetical protein [Clostridia bacterium]